MKSFIVIIIPVFFVLAASAAFAQEGSGYLRFENLERIDFVAPATATGSDLLGSGEAHWDNEEPRVALKSEAVYTRPACDCNASGKRNLLTPFAEFLKAASRRPVRKLTCGTFRGEASWYNLPGNRYFNGQPFDGSQNHAAHKTLPMGTVVTVHCPNGRSIDVTIVDDGPHVRGRIIDLVPAPANRCGIRQPGHAPVTLEVKCPIARGDDSSSSTASRDGAPVVPPTLGSVPPLDEETSEPARPATNGSSLPETPAIPGPAPLDEGPLT